MACLKMLDLAGRHETANLGIENPRVGGSIPSKATSDIKGLQ